jgi:hypothetical protein
LDELIELGVADIRYSLHTLDSDIYKKITQTNKHTHVLKMIQYSYEKTLGMDTRIIVTGEIIEENEHEVEALKNFKYADTIELWKPHNWTDWGDLRPIKKKKASCGRPINGPLQIQVDGTVNMCCFDYNGKLLLGDLKTQSLQEIFNAPEYLDLRMHHENGTLDQTNYICKNCDQRNEDNGEFLVFSNAGDERVGKLSTTYKSLD